jgi:hypothetical protein
MTKKDYELIADTFYNLKEIAIQSGHVFTFLMIVANLATQLEIDNPLFKRDLFFKACGLGN